MCTLAIQKTGIPINTKSAKRKLRAYGIVIERVRAGNGTAEESGKTVRRRSRNKIIITDDADALHDRGTYHCSGVDKVLEKFTEVKEDIYEKRIERLILEEDGIGTVEMILILVVLIALVTIFKSQLTTLVGELFTSLSENAKGI